MCQSHLCYRLLLLWHSTTLLDSAISIEPKQHGYEASTLVEVKTLEKVNLLVVCNEGPLPLQKFDRVRKDERLIISKERYKPQDAVTDIKSEYQRLRTRLSNYLCKI